MLNKSSINTLTTTTKLSPARGMQVNTENKIVGTKTGATLYCVVSVVEIYTRTGD